MRWLSQQLGTLQMRQMDRQSCLMHEGMHKGMSNDVVGLVESYLRMYLDATIDTDLRLGGHESI